jgi:hypothetical protein
MAIDLTVKELLNYSKKNKGIENNSIPLSIINGVFISKKPIS